MSSFAVTRPETEADVTLAPLGLKSIDELRAAGSDVLRLVSAGR